MHIPNLVIEVTRKCQFNCAHCLRGKAQNKDIKTEYIDDMLNGIESISTLGFTGGEPSLNVGAIEHTLDVCKRNGIDVDSFYVATNGNRISESFVIAMLKWYAYCSTNEITSVQISNDNYHAFEGTYDTGLLFGLTFVERKYDIEANDITKVLIREGNAKENGIGKRELKRVTVTTIEELQEAQVYLNCNGYAVLDCDYSYASQNRYKLCKASEFAQWYAKLDREEY